MELVPFPRLAISGEWHGQRKEISPPVKTIPPRAGSAGPMECGNRTSPRVSLIVNGVISPRVAKDIHKRGCGESVGRDYANLDIVVRNCAIHRCGRDSFPRLGMETGGLGSSTNQRNLLSCKVLMRIVLWFFEAWRTSKTSTPSLRWSKLSVLTIRTRIIDALALYCSYVLSD